MIQRKVVGLLWLVPIFAATSWLSLVFPEASVYVDMARDCYEAYCLHLFLSLMLCYLGDDRRLSVLLDSLPEDRSRITHIFPFNFFLRPWRLDSNFIRNCKRGTLQFCLLKPITAFLAVALQIGGVYHEGSFNPQYGYPYISFVLNCSITWAAYVLLLFYLAFKPELAPFRPVPKFLCIKAILFLSFWQAVVLAGLSQFNVIHAIGSYTTTDVKTGINDFLICFEMCFIACAHRMAFRWQDEPRMEHPGEQAIERSLLDDNFAVEDTLRDLNDANIGGIVVPTSFKPTAKDVEGSDTPEKVSSEAVTLGPIASASSKDMGDWRL